MSLNNQKGFTLVELLTIIVIISILSMGAVAIFSNNTKAAKKTIVLNDTRIMYSTADLLYYSEVGEYPTTFNDIVVAGYISERPQNPFGANYIYARTEESIVFAGQKNISDNTFPTITASIKDPTFSPFVFSIGDYNLIKAQTTNGDEFVTFIAGDITVPDYIETW